MLIDTCMYIVLWGSAEGMGNNVSILTEEGRDGERALQTSALVPWNAVGKTPEAAQETCLP